MKSCDAVIIGAGPYGLSIAAHLRAANVDFRIFGSPMHTWVEHMPRGMRLKSDGFASSLYEPDSQFTLEAFCKEKDLPYADDRFPIPIETFVAYGLEFQKRFVPRLEHKSVVSVRRNGEGYSVALDDGEVIASRKVIVAAGLSYYPYLPPVLSGLPETHVTHSSKHKTLDHFKGRRVIVIGAGSSALETAALLHKCGTDVRVIARAPVINLWEPPPPPPATLFQWLQKPQSGLGRGWKLYLCAHAPLIFRMMPLQFRLGKVKRVLGPSPGWFLTNDIKGKIPLHPGLSIKKVGVENDRVKLDVADAAGAVEMFEADHLIAGTGYKVDLRRLPFLNSEVLSQIRSVENTPMLSSNFESSLPGLYFVGASAANTFGPLLRFAVGAKFTSRRVARHLARSPARNGGQARTHSDGYKVQQTFDDYAGKSSNA